ncbi:hypothetical protein NQ317_016390 [Molorchus minor]|uniref:Uncharacterized protein n=1 Tax=Molorchus minor TaxID=1323400 RepID=A0ABQ9JJY7_9CUCU|nr:hypothetical protein NQ317_016390 [Molorchus minor]
MKLLLFVVALVALATLVTCRAESSGNKLPSEAIPLREITGFVSAQDVNSCSQSNCDSQCRAVQWAGGVCISGECWCYRYS